MNNIQLKATQDTPGVLFESETGTMELNGRSLPEDANGFYEPLVNWLNAYSENPQKKTTFNFKLEYYNTSSAKQILKILWLLEELSKKKHDVTINWYYHTDDKDMYSSGERYAKLTTVKFNLVKA